MAGEEQFHEQLRMLHGNRYNPILPDQLHDFLARATVFFFKPMMVTMMALKRRIILRHGRSCASMDSGAFFCPGRLY